MNKSKHMLSGACNGAAALLVLYCIGLFFVPDATFAEGDNIVAWHCFRYFTIDSNLLMAVAALCLLPLNIKAQQKGKGSMAIPHNTFLLKYVGTVAVSLTFLVVMCFLGPILGYIEMLSGPNMYLHLICPLLAVLSFCVAEVGEISFKESLWGLLPVAVYGLVYLVMVVVVKGWPDFYMFNATGMWPLSFLAIAAASFVICQLLRLPHRPKKD